jgi:hypothetical protein
MENFFFRNGAEQYLANARRAPLWARCGTCPTLIFGKQSSIYMHIWIYHQFCIVFEGKTKEKYELDRQEENNQVSKRTGLMLARPHVVDGNQTSVSCDSFAPIMRRTSDRDSCLLSHLFRLLVFDGRRESGQTPRRDFRPGDQDLSLIVSLCLRLPPRIGCFHPTRSLRLPRPPAKPSCRAPLVLQITRV